MPDADLPGAAAATTLSLTLFDALARFEAYCRTNSEFYLQKHHSLVAAHFAPKFVLRDQAFSLSPCEPISVFHAQQYIALSLASMAQRLMTRLTVGEEELAAALVLCARFAARSQPVTRHMLHRLFVAALHLSLKAHSDRFFSLAVLSRATGVPQAELARLEVAFAKAIRFRFAVLLSQDELATASSPLEAVVKVADDEMRFARLADAERSDPEFASFVSAPSPTDEIEEDEAEVPHVASQQCARATVQSSPRSMPLSPSASPVTLMVVPSA